MEVELNQEHEGQKTRSRWIERCRYRAGEAVTHTCAVLLATIPPLISCTSPTTATLSASLLLPYLNLTPSFLPFPLLPPDPDRETLQDCGIITLFPCRLELLSELTLTVWSAPPHRDHSGPSDSHRCWWSYVWKQRQAPLLHPAGGALLLCGAKDRYLWQPKRLLGFNSALVVKHWRLYKSQKSHTRDLIVQK